MASSSTRLENSWAFFFGQHPLQEASHRRLMDLPAMCDLTAAVKTRITKMSNNANLLVLGIAANNKDGMALHHSVELGDSRFIPELCVVTLFCIGDIATSLMIDCAESFKAFSLNLPTWEDLYNASDTAEHIKAEPAQADSSFTSSSMIKIPKVLAVSIMTSASKDATDVGVLVDTNIAHREVITQSDASADSFMTHCRYVLSFCCSLKYVCGGNSRIKDAGK
jgi:hypothetical protein